MRRALRTRSISKAPLNGCIQLHPSQMPIHIDFIYEFMGLHAAQCRVYSVQCSVYIQTHTQTAHTPRILTTTSVAPSNISQSINLKRFLASARTSSASVNLSRYAFHCAIIFVFISLNSLSLITLQRRNTSK